MIQWEVRNGEWQKLQDSGEHRLLLNTGLRHRGGLGVDGTVPDGDGSIHTNVCLHQNLWSYSSSERGHGPAGGSRVWRVPGTRRIRVASAGAMSRNLRTALIFGGFISLIGAAF